MATTAAALTKTQGEGSDSLALGFLDFDATDRIREIHRKYGNPLLTSGAFGDVSIAINVAATSDNACGGDRWRMAVVKTIPQATVSKGGKWDRHAKRMLSPQVFNEIMALRLLSSHPNVVTFHGLVESDSTAMLAGGISLAFEYSPLDVHMLLEMRDTLLPINVCKTMSRDILNALQHCHANGILHRDVKPGNFLISNTGRLALCDFGLAKPCPSLLSTKSGTLSATDSDEAKTAATDNGLCTLWYRSPEVLLGGAANHPAVDMYSAGLVMAELITGRVLFRGRGVLDQLGRIFALLGTPAETHWPKARQLPDYGKVSFAPKSPQSLLLAMPRISETDGLQDLMQSLVCLDPAKRLSAEEALQHNWFSAAASSLLPSLPATQGVVANELCIPRNLREPLLLFSAPEVNDDTLTVARRQALKIAHARRSFLRKGNSSSMDGELPTLVEACKALSP